MSTDEVLVADNIFQYCTPSSERKWTHTTVTFGLGILVAVILKGLAHFTKNIVNGKSINIIFIICTPPLLLLGSISYFYEENQEFGSLMHCSPFVPSQMTIYAIAKWTTFASHTYFFLKTLLIWTVHFHVDWASSIINIALFVQDIMAIIMNQHLLAFQYLFFYNYFCPEARAFLARMANKLFPSYRIVSDLLLELFTIIILLGGCLRAAEEWETNEYIHPDFNGAVTPMKSIWVYYYWIVITISTVGFGDLTPSTSAGQLVIMSTIAIFVIWFVAHLSKLDNQVHQRPSQDHKTEFLFVMGCRNERQLLNFLASFRNPPQNVKVYVDSKDTEFSAVVRELGLDVTTALSKKEALMMTVCPDHARDTVFFLRDPVVDADEADRCNLDFVRIVRGYRCKSVLFVEMAKLEHQQLIQYVSGWNNTGRDVCISLEKLSAHMLALSAHSRLVPGIVGGTFGKHLFIDNIAENHRQNFDKAVSHSHALNGNLLLGAIGENNELLINPNQTKSNWPHILLATENHIKDFPTRQQQRMEIQTRSIDSRVSVTEPVSEALSEALMSHPITQTDPLSANVIIHESKIRPENDSKSLLEFLDAKPLIRDTRLVSIMEHGYEACILGDGLCLCGTYQIQSLLVCLLATAYHDQHLYKVWKKLIEEDLLEVEEIRNSCSYKQLFQHLLSHQKIPLGVETVQDRDGKSLSVPILNPEYTLELKKGDYVLFIKNT